MTQKNNHFYRELTRCVCLLAAIAPMFISQVEASNIYWATATGGLFGDSGNWATSAGGSPPAGPPGSNDNSYFTVIGSPYTVTFDGSATNARILLWDSTSHFNLGGNSYFLSHWSDNNISYVGFGSATEPATAVFSNGTLKTSGMNVTGAADAPGKMTMTGNDMLWQHVDPISSTNTIQDVRIGLNAGGTGTVEILAGAKAELRGMQLGYYNGTIGAVLVNGSGTVLSNSGPALVGRYGLGVLRVETGGLWLATAHVCIADTSASFGTVTVAGAGAQLLAKSTMYVGNSGDGSLIISDGATAAVSSLFYVGNAAGSVGRVELSGAGTLLTNGSLSYIGLHGAGSVRVSDGAEWRCGNSAFRLGYYADGAGTVTVSGAGAKLFSDAVINVGYNGTGALIVTNGAQARFGSVSAGESAGSYGNIVIAGAGSLLTNSGTPFIGNYGEGHALIADGAEWRSGHNIYLGYQASGNGSLFVSGGAAVNLIGTRSIYLCGLSAASGGSALLALDDGGAVNISERLRVWPGGTIRVADGIITTPELDMKSTAILAVTLHTGFTNVLIAVNNNATIDGVEFHLDTADDFRGHDNQVFTIIDAGGTLSGEFSGLPDDSTIKAGNRVFRLNYDTDNGLVTLTYLCPSITLIRLR